MTQIHSHVIGSKVTELSVCMHCSGWVLGYNLLVPLVSKVHGEKRSARISSNTEIVSYHNSAP